MLTTIGYISEFAELAEGVCPNINILYVDKESVDIEKPKLNAM